MPTLRKLHFRLAMQVSPAVTLQVACQRFVLLASACYATGDHGWLQYYIQLLQGVHGENVCTKAGRATAAATFQKLSPCSAARPVQVHISERADGQEVIDIAIISSKVAQMVIIPADLVKPVKLLNLLPTRSPTVTVCRAPAKLFM